MTSREIEILPPTAQFPATNWFIKDTKQAVWTAEENKRFEKALAFYDDNPDRWLKIAAAIPGKTVADVIIHYKELENDVSDIEAGLIPIPGYAACDDHDGGFSLQDWRFDDGDYVVGGKRYSPAATSKHFAPPEKERKKGIPWTEEEHRRFLMGLKKYGKGDWRNISRNFVTTRTPTQVASHAQKYFIRQLSGGKDKRRSSIHDITTVNVPDHNHDLEPSDSFTSSATATALSSSSFHQTFLGQKAGHGFAFASSFGSYDAFQTWN